MSAPWSELFILQRLMPVRVYKLGWRWRWEVIPRFREVWRALPDRSEWRYWESWRDWASCWFEDMRPVLACWWQGHPGQVFYNPAGFEPDYHCTRCGIEY